jgi:hypothetical protein
MKKFNYFGECKKSIIFADKYIFNFKIISL